MEKKLIAIYGGSFNPPTSSHFQILGKVMEEITIDGKSFDEIWMVPCGDRKDKKIGTPGEKR